jgi:hypothetical protein
MYLLLLLPPEILDTTVNPINLPIIHKVWEEEALDLKGNMRQIIPIHRFYNL